MTIVTLTGDNGLLQKAQNAGEQSKIAGAEEQIKLLYAEYQISKYAEGNTSAGNYLKEQLEKTYGEGNVDVISSEESIVLKIIENGESKFYEYNTSTGISKELQKGINYNGKTPSEIRPGDDITIVTEKFKVFSVSDGKIKAMPYYNITLTNTPVQSSIAETISFATRSYWSKDENGNEIDGWKDNAFSIDMNNDANNIQVYIGKYKNTLDDLGAKFINVRIGLDYELTDIDEPLRNGAFWIGTASTSNTNFVCYMNINGHKTGGWFTKNYGVRPIIEIPIE